MGQTVEQAVKLNTMLLVVFLQSRHHWLLTVAAENIVRLLYPLKYQHVYIPVMPSSLADYLEVRFLVAFLGFNVTQVHSSAYLGVLLARLATRPVGSPSILHVAVPLLGTFDAFCCAVLCCALMCFQAPTPFLMGLHSAEPVDPRTLDGLVAADLDRGTLQLGKDDGLLRRCLNHPYMQRLERRVRCAAGTLVRMRRRQHTINKRIEGQ